MPDINSTSATEAVRIVGTDATGGELTPVKSTSTGELQVTDTPNDAAAYNTINVGVTAVLLKVGGSALSGRKLVSMQPIDGKIFYGYDASVTSSNGTELAKKQIIVFPAGESITIYMISGLGTVDVRIGELA